MTFCLELCHTRGARKFAIREKKKREKKKKRNQEEAETIKINSTILDLDGAQRFAFRNIFIDAIVMRCINCRCQ